MFAVILKVLAAINVGNVVIVFDATPPTLLTVAVPVTSDVPLNDPLV